MVPEEISGEAALPDAEPELFVDGPSDEQPIDTPAPVTVEVLRTHQRVLFVSPDLTSERHVYRCVHNADAVRLAGHEARVVGLFDVNPELVAWADAIILWRVEYSIHVDIMMMLARQKTPKTKVFYDADDLGPRVAPLTAGLDPEAGTGVPESSVLTEWSSLERHALAQSDGGLSPNCQIVREMSVLRGMSFLLPDIFQGRQLRNARRAVRWRAAIPGDGCFRIGYFAEATSQTADLQTVLPVLLTIMSEFPQIRLVLFRRPGDVIPALLAPLADGLAGIERQIEWREAVQPERVPEEMARLNVLILPLDRNNPLSEGRSEIRFVEASLCDVPCVLSATRAYRRIIEHRDIGLLAETVDDWAQAFRRLLASPDVGPQMARAARNYVMWHYSPQRQARTFHTLLSGLASERSAAAAAETLLGRQVTPAWQAPIVPDAVELFHADQLGAANVTVVITSFNYGHVIVDALESVREQTETYLDLVVVDDGSTDGSPDVIVAWCEANRTRFNRILVVQASRNAGLGAARNIGMDRVETPYAMQLDADNRLLPAACRELALIMDQHEAAYAYPTLRMVGGRDVMLLGERRVDPLGFAGGNSIDAMAMVAKWAWLAVGGYYVNRDAMGWEDYDLWCSFAERGLHGVHHDEVLAEYRVHEGSMTNTVTETAAHKKRVVNHVTERHRWIALFDETARPREI